MPLRLVACTDTPTAPGSGVGTDVDCAITIKDGYTAGGTRDRSHRCDYEKGVCVYARNKWRPINKYHPGHALAA